MKNNRKDLVKELNNLLIAAKSSYKAMHNNRLSNSFKKITSLADYQKLPFTTREDFYDFNLSKKFAYLKRSRLDENEAEPILPLTEADYWRYVESEVGRFRAMGVKKTDRVSVINFTINESVPIVNSLMKLGVSYVVTEGEIKFICNDLISKKVDVIFTYHRMLEQIIEYLESESLKLSLRLVIVTAEPIKNKKTLKKRVKATLGAELIDTIGTREIGGYAYECQEKNCYHFLDSIYAETIDPQTKKPTNQKGELLITPLWRKDLPLIKFTTKDLVKLEKKTCSCKTKNDLVFKKLLGRADQSVKVGYSMINLRKIYFETRKLINYQYPIVDHFLWRIIPEINFSLLLLNEKEVDTLIIFVEKDKFNLSLRRNSFIISRLSHRFNIGVEIKLISSPVFVQVAKNKYWDIRYTERSKLPNFLLKIIGQ